MVLSNAERQARHRQRQKYELDLQRKQIALLEEWVNELQAKVGLPQKQLPKSAHDPHR